MKQIYRTLLTLCTLTLCTTAAWGWQVPTPDLTLLISTSADTMDINPGDGECWDSNGECSLRAAIMEADQQIKEHAPDAYYVTIAFEQESQLSTTTLTINDSITAGPYDNYTRISIVADGTPSNQFTIDASGINVSPFELTDANVAIYDATLTNASDSFLRLHAESGAPNASVLLLHAVHCTNNTAMHGPCVYAEGNQIPPTGPYFVLQGDYNAEQPALFTNNSATGDGGAIYLAHGSADFSFAEFANNFSTGSGGAVYVENESRLGSIFTNYHGNVSHNGSGGAVYVGDHSTYYGFESHYSENIATNDGGALAVQTSGATMHGDVFVENTARDGGAIYYNSTQNATFAFEIDKSAYGAHAELQNNIAFGSTMNNVESQHTTITSIKNAVIGLRAAVFNPRGADYSQVNGKGGAINLKVSNTQAKSATINNMTDVSHNAASYGGGIYSATAAWDIEESYFANNVATTHGGAMYATGVWWNGANINVLNSQFDQNYAEGDGGAATLHNSIASTFDHCTFNDNAAGDQGQSLAYGSNSPNYSTSTFNPLANAVEPY